MEPVLIVMDGEYLVECGQPNHFTSKTLAKYAKEGYKIETITIGEYRKKEWKWIYEKPKSGVSR